ncbi:MAG TPA: ribonuclease Y [Clostridiaceae bacterium]|jgi:ribonuclease Y|nr:ribonuclease Y [Clostridiaceae bacterium]
MEVIGIEFLYIAIGLIVGAAISVWLTVNYYRKGLSKESIRLAEQKKQTEAQAERLIGDARKEGEEKKREFLLEARQEVLNVRSEIEREVKARRQELQRDRNRLEQKETSLDKKLNQIEEKEQRAEQKARELEMTEQSLLALEQEKIQTLERVSGLSVHDAQQQVLEEARVAYHHDLAVMYRQMEEETKARAEDRSKEIVVSAIQRYASDYVSDATVTVVALPNEEMKGRIIGREGRNIRTIETLTGVDLIIDDTPEAVILSSFDPIRREIARLTIEKLVQDGRIHPARIEEMVGKATREIENSIREAGEQAIFETGVIGVHPEAVRLLGRLKYRTSYGQNVLQHAIEVSWLTGIMAADLDLDVMTAKRAGLLHDIGKAIDFEVEGTHISLGSELARKYKFDEATINAIESHHGDVEPTGYISFLVAAADAISAARPGARRENIETYIKRIEKLEEIANSTAGVEKSFAIQAGREIRVMVLPDQISDEELPLKAREIAKQIESEVNFPGQIKISMIRESRFVDYAK